MMQSDWILDVLADLKTFALSRDLPALAEHLDDTALVALAEIAASEEKKAGQAQGDIIAARRDIGEIGASEHA
ncbi:hypothetical protein [Sulfitobacter aestuariivivens]|uniref:hypothetical protein n=1 Tax=Sulfitobacter aestuariivivens TaxID=2766981 RepID=UPI001FE346C9|nr:hypothetical protein [Sulfitobacter aestuariivivens]